MLLLLLPLQPLPFSDFAQAYWVWGFAIFAGSVTLVSVVRAVLFFTIALKASSAIHNSMVERVSRGRRVLMFKIFSRVKRSTIMRTGIAPIR